MASDDSGLRNPGGSAARRALPPVPRGTGSLGMWLFLVSLTMLFVAAMVLYVVIRFAGDKSPHAGALHFPPLLWLSTALVISVSFTMSRAVHSIRLERQSAFLNWLGVSMFLALAFLAVQAPAMAGLVLQHARQQRAGAGTFLYRLIFFLILIHALHVLGGMVALGRLTLLGSRGVYDHEHFQPVRHTARYWHFLDLIWILMFLTFLLTA